MRTVRTEMKRNWNETAARTQTIDNRAIDSGPTLSDVLMWLALTAAAFLALASPAAAQEQQRPLIDVQHYDIEARVDPASQTLQARAVVTFVPREETREVVFELHNGLDVSRIADAAGNVLSPTRYRQDFTVRATYNTPPAVGQPTQLTFDYAGAVLGYEDSPIEGVDVANLSVDGGWLLYPARWFPVNGFEADQFSAKISLEVPAGYKVVGSGIGTSADTANGKNYTFDFTQDSFPGSVAIVKGDPILVSSQGAQNSVYFRGGSEDLAREYGQAAGEMMEFFTGKFGAPYSRSLTIVELGDYSPDGYAAPGLVFLSPYGMKNTLNRKLLGEQVAHQWWRCIVTPGNRNNVWLDQATAWYSALMEIANAEGDEAFDTAIRETRVEALTYTDIPISESGRLPAFSPEGRALYGAKGAMVLHMLRWVIGDDNFEKLLGEVVNQYAYKSIVTADFERIAEQITGKDLSPFFLQWIESTQTPEFKQEYTIYRLGGGKGFQVLGKVEQDMDTFQMPVELKIETEGEPEYRTVQVKGTSSDYTVEAFGKPKRVILDPNHRILRYDDEIRVKVSIRKGEQLVELGYYTEALQEYQKSLDINRYSSLAHYRIAEVFFLQNNYQSAANEFREALNGDQEPEWTIVWAHINLGKIFDITGQRERAVNEYQLAIRTRDNTQNAQDEARKYLENPYRRERKEERIY